jgi:hypothetical protein
LDGKPEPVMLAAVAGDPFAVAIIEVEVPGQNFRRRFSSKTAVALALFLGQKFYWHLYSFRPGHAQNLGVLRALTISLFPGLLRLQKSGAKGYRFARSFAKP